MQSPRQFPAFRARIVLTALPLLLGGGLSTACGSTDVSTFDEFAPSSASAKPAPAPADFGDIGVPVAPDACGSVVTDGKLSPVNLVLLFDRSGSMGSDDAFPKACTADAQCNAGVNCLKGNGGTNGTCSELGASKWTPAKDAVVTFLSDPATAGLRASLDAFSKDPGSPALSCSASSYYVAPLVGLTTLPNAATFQTELDKLYPTGSTPTYPALDGALRFAKASLAGATNGERAVVVLVTDGEPYTAAGLTSCGDGPNTPDGVAALADQYAKQGILTYVVGVGINSVNLDLIARAGGTSTAISASVGTAPQTKQSLLDALHAIRAQVSSCSLAIPAPGGGREPDFNSLTLTVGGQSVAQTADCSGSAGWRYDNQASPRQVELCGSSCDAAKKGAQVSFSFGCSSVVR